MWSPDLDRSTDIYGLMLLAIIGGILVILAHISRESGKKVEKRLFQSWGGNLTAQWLMHTNDTLEESTKNRYHSFLKDKIRGWYPPSAQQERIDIKYSHDVYTSAVRWLREQTRDRTSYPLVFKENVSYGFRKNLLGMKPWGRLVAFICLFSTSWHLCGTLSSSDGGHLLFDVILLMFNVIVILWWHRIVNDSWVKSSGKEYSRALLAACDGHHLGQHA